MPSEQVLGESLGTVSRTGDQGFYDLLVTRAAAEYPRLSIAVRSESWLAPFFWVLEKVTRRNYDSFVTTVFSTIYVGDDWDEESLKAKARVLRHELVHVRQFHCWPLGRKLWPVNHVLMALAYLFLLPVLWTMRAKFEREAYTETLLDIAERDGPQTEASMDRTARWLSDIFGGPSYLFMWRRKSAYEWAMDTQRRIDSKMKVDANLLRLRVWYRDRNSGDGEP